ncbi:MAG: sugar phosphate nucleotidyltransferase [Candidatus Bathyarchaeales archaeon]
MKAVILAGGFGTRLRPLSCTRPKLLFPIGNKPLLDWTLENLAKSKIDEVILAVNYMAEAFVHRYSNTAHGMKLHYSRETMPLGTGGPIKKAEDLIGHDKPFLVLNGDIFTTIDYAEVVKKHKKNGATATIMLYQVEDPTRYGTVKLTKNNQVIKFIEKPSKGKAPSNLINAGVYVMEPEIFSLIPSNQRISIEREVFPKLAAKKKLYAYPFKGLWVDIGKHEDYLYANRLLLSTERRKLAKKGNHMEKDVEIEHPVVIGKDVRIEEKSKIGPYTAIGDNVTVGKGVHVENSIIFPNAIVSDFTSIRGAIIGEGAIIGKWVKIEDNCVVGDYTMIKDNITLTQGVTVCPSKEVSESVLSPKCIM